MRFSKMKDIYKIVRSDNILGISFAENDSDETNVEVIEWVSSDQYKKITSKEEVLKQVVLGLKEINESLETNYKLSKIYFSPFDSSQHKKYSALIMMLIRHYHKGNEFEEP